ncbi:MAG TPA: ABC transporter ATP-binding protein [Kiloniellales bacterium]|nr:ABC transporter ATP-binding protein [Kiloniellales bacterium]
MSEALLEVKDLSVTFGSGPQAVRAVRGISFKLDKGETLALVGESGSGKSVTALSILQLLPYPLARHDKASSVRLRGKELMGASEAELREVRGNEIAMIFQEPMTSLNPLHTILKQVSEALIIHKKMGRAHARARVLQLLRLVGLKDPEKRLDAYPHQLSGGQRQRVMIAMALANEPDILIADEPTTALDVTIQAQVLGLLRRLQRELGMALLLITHDLSIVRRMADRVAVMTEGEIVETGTVKEIFERPQHAYTQKLLAAQPRGAAAPVPAEAPMVMQSEDLKVHFPIKRGVLKRTVDHVRAVDGVDVAVRAGETLGVVGESGSGKTTLGFALLRLVPEAKGPVVFKGARIDSLSQSELRPLRRELQVVFQDPYGSLSPRLTVGEIIAEGLDIHEPRIAEAERQSRIADALKEVGLQPEMADRYPHEFSGGQRQRIAIARAMILKPDFVVLDEPTSALDMSVQAQIVELLRDLQRKHRLAYLFISHDLRVVRAMAHRVLVLKDGKMVETGEAAALFERPRQPYTQTLLKAALEVVIEEPVAAG